MAIGVLRTLTAAGVRVPGQVAVTGFDDLYPARLLNRIAHPGLSPAVQLLPTELVLRSSCGCPPGTETRQTIKTLKPG